MRLHRFARTVVAGLIGAGAIGVTAVVGGAGVSRAEPENPTPPIIDDFVVLNPAISLNPRDRDGPTTSWPGTGNYCQNRFIKCRVGGF
jgi:hypothetical protein